MTERLHKSNGKIGATAALLFGLSFSSVHASDLIKSACGNISKAPEGVEVPAPPLTMKLAEHGLADSSADMKAPAADPAGEKLTSPTLAADATESTLVDTEDTSTVETDAAAAADDLPETSLRLPGVSDEELPRYRRQMYRTDI